MKTKKRTKRTRLRGSHTAKRGAMKKARGKGHRGGVGKAGSGKRGDQKKVLIDKSTSKPYFGKERKLRRGPTKKLEAINLRDIEDKIEHFTKKGIAKKEGGHVSLNLEGYKILSLGEVTQKLKISASAASKSAIDKVKKAGGDITLNK